MTKNQIEVITSVERRRRWSMTEKERIVAASMEPGAVASEVAREAGIHASQLFRWRQQLCEPAAAAPTFTPVLVAPEPGSIAASSSPVPPAMIEIEFATGARLRMTGAVEGSTISALIRALAKPKRSR
jgi:transposase